MDTTKDNLYKKIKGLPQDIQDVYFSDDFSQKILDTGKKYGLAIDKIGILGDEIRNVMLGIIQTADFIKNISDGLGVDKEKARMIAEDVNQQIFQPVKASLRKVHGLPEEPGTPTPAKPAPPVPTPPYAIPARPSFAPSAVPPPAPSMNSPYVIPTKQPTEPPKPATGPTSTVIIGDTKMDFAPLPPKKPEPMPPIFAKKITPIDTLLDRADAEKTPLKPKIDSASLQLNPPPSSGIRTMFQDAKAFMSRSSSPAGSEPIVPTPVQSPTAPIAPVTPPQPIITMPKQEKFNTIPPPVSPAPEAHPKPIIPPPSKPETTILNMPPKQESTASLNHADIKTEIENALGGKIKIGDNSITDPYREPVE